MEIKLNSRTEKDYVPKPGDGIVSCYGKVWFTASNDNGFYAFNPSDGYLSGYYDSVKDLLDEGFHGLERIIPSEKLVLEELR